MVYQGCTAAVPKTYQKRTKNVHNTYQSRTKAGPVACQGRGANVPKTYQKRTKNVHNPENPRLIQFQINHNFSVFRVHARPFARVQFSSRPCASLHPCAHFRVPHAVVRRSDLRVSCVAVRARARGAVCRLTAVPASKAAHARPMELLVCVAVLLVLLVPV